MSRNSDPPLLTPPRTLVPRTPRRHHCSWCLWLHMREMGRWGARAAAGRPHAARGSWASLRPRPQHLGGVMAPLQAAPLLLRPRTKTMALLTFHAYMRVWGRWAGQGV